MTTQNIVVSGAASTEMATTGTATAAAFQKPKPQKKKRPQKRLPESIKLGATSGELFAEESTLVGSSNIAKSVVEENDKNDDGGGVKSIRSSLRRSGQMHREVARMSTIVIPRTQDLPHLWVEQDRELRILRPENKDLKEAVDKLEVLYNSARETNVENNKLISAFSKRFQDQHRANEVCIAENGRLQDAVKQSDLKLHECLEEAKKSSRSRDEMAMTIEGLQKRLRRANEKDGEKDEEIANLQTDLKDYVILQAKAGVLKAANKKLDADRIATQEQLANLFEHQRGLEEQLRECEAEREATKQDEERRIRQSLQRPVSTAANSLAGDNLENLGVDGESSHSGKRFSVQFGKRPTAEKPLPEKPLPKQPLFTYPQGVIKLETTPPQSFLGDTSSNILEADLVPEVESDKRSASDSAGSGRFLDVKPAAAEEPAKESSKIVQASTNSEVKPSAADPPEKKSSFVQVPTKTILNIEPPIFSPTGLYYQLESSIRTGNAVEFTPVEAKPGPRYDDKSVQTRNESQDTLSTMHESSSTDDHNLEDWRVSAEDALKRVDGGATTLSSMASVSTEPQTSGSPPCKCGDRREFRKGSQSDRGRAQPITYESRGVQTDGSSAEAMQASARRVQRHWRAALPNLGWWFILLGLILLWYLDFFGSGDDQQLWLDANDFTRRRVLELRDEKWMFPLWVLRCIFSLENMLSVDRVLLA